MAILSPKIFEGLSYSIAAAARGKQHAVRLRLPKGDAWTRVGDHVMLVLNGHAPTPQDTSRLTVSLDDIVVRGDTLTSTVFIGGANLCADGKWKGGGTSTGLMSVRSGKYWTGVKETDIGYSDGWCLEALKTMQRAHSRAVEPQWLAPRPPDSIRTPPRKPMRDGTTKP